jgi:hypothetical protein
MMAAMKGKPQGAAEAASSSNPTHWFTIYLNEYGGAAVHPSPERVVYNEWVSFRNITPCKARVKSNGSDALFDPDDFELQPGQDKTVRIAYNPSGKPEYKTYKVKVSCKLMVLQEQQTFEFEAQGGSDPGIIIDP